ncbi:MAG: hypothetical protein CMJ81_20495 [Planctomycetaceae bacterium]|nr:hypothetical protein [Planctomycetaceae bacterium]MBP63463.1 hypothetical protein [Planctomycetaceae bacterium]
MLACSSLLFAFGCGRQEEIRTFRVPKPDLVEQRYPEQTPDRTLGAIILRDSQGWFFKLTGPHDVVGDQVESFREFIRSVRFSEAPNEAPVWSTPDKWKSLPGTGIRFATLQIPTRTDPLDLSVTPLSLPPQNSDAYVLSNINRWRKELGLTPLSAPDDSQTIKTVALEDGQATLVDLSGHRSANARGHVPGTTNPTTTDSLDRAPTVSQPQVEYVTPPGWQPGERVVSRGGITLRYVVALEVVDGDQRVEITVSTFPPRMANVLDNVNRWRLQIGLEKIQGNELEKQLKNVRVGNITGQLIELTSPDKIQPQQTIYAVLTSHAGLTWFIKLKGDTELAVREQKHFEQFFSSIRF